jgi:hypothetical protein
MKWTSDAQIAVLSPQQHLTRPGNRVLDVAHVEAAVTRYHRTHPHSLVLDSFSIIRDRISTI